MKDKNIHTALLSALMLALRSALAPIMLLCAIFMCAQPAHAITKQTADNSYKTGNYQQAINEYNQLLKQGVSASIYYNLGNAYYRSDSIPNAILCYERALRLAPGDKDIRFNLQFASSKTIDKITPVEENVFAAWYKSVVTFTGVDTWAYMSIACVIIALLLMLVFLFTSREITRKAGFYGSLVSLALFVFASLFAWQQKSSLENRAEAIVMKPVVSVKSSPVEKSSDAFVIHEGTKVSITDGGIKGWSGIRLGDGREGWVLSSALEEI